MIEVPSAALVADGLAEVADFFSIGTNDLVQYTLAADRTNPALAELATPLQPAVLRLIAGVVAAARARGRHVAVCGEAAADPEMVPVLVGLGVDELSVAPSSVGRRRGARSPGLRLADCETLAPGRADGHDRRCRQATADRRRLSRALRVRRPAPPRGRAQEVERIGPAIEPRHECPEVDEVVEADRARPEPEQRLELDDRQRQGQDAEPDRDGQPDQAPPPRIAGEDRPEHDRAATSSRWPGPTARRRVSGR